MTFFCFWCFLSSIREQITLRTALILLITFISVFWLFYKAMLVWGIMFAEADPPGPHNVWLVLTLEVSISASPRREKDSILPRASKSTMCCALKMKRCSRRNRPAIARGRVYDRGSGRALSNVAGNVRLGRDFVGRRGVQRQSKKMSLSPTFFLFQFYFLSLIGARGVVAHLCAPTLGHYYIRNKSICEDEFW